MADFGGLESEGVAGPLIGGGVAQVGLLATKLLGKNSPTMIKYAPLIGTLLGGAASAALYFTGRRAIGISGMVTAAIVGLPRQLEEMLVAQGVMKDYLGVITAEQEMAGYFGANEAPVEMLGGGGFGVITAEQEMAGAGDVEMLGADNGIEMLGSGAGFGSNFLSAQ